MAIFASAYYSIYYEINMDNLPYLEIDRT